MSFHYDSHHQITLSEVHVAKAAAYTWVLYLSQDMLGALREVCERFNGMKVRTANGEYTKAFAKAIYAAAEIVLKSPKVANTRQLGAHRVSTGNPVLMFRKTSSTEGVVYLRISASVLVESRNYHEYNHYDIKLCETNASVSTAAGCAADAFEHPDHRSPVLDKERLARTIEEYNRLVQELETLTSEANAARRRFETLIWDRSVVGHN